MKEKCSIKCYLILSSFILLVGCESFLNTNEDKKDSLLSIESRSGDSIFPPPKPPVVYLTKNNYYFVSWERDILFHDKYTNWDVCTVYPVDDQKPLYVGLQPNDFMKITSLENFKSKISKGDIGHAYLISDKDSITDKRYFKVKSILEKKGWRISTRVLVQEEENVFKAMRLGENYDPNQYDWDKTVFLDSAFQK